ncbi:MAG: amino-acid N-acetyltransferase [Thalassotalea sp.]
MDLNNQHTVKWFRSAAPYINAHRGKTFVLTFGGEAVLHPNFSNIIHDIALLRSLGVKLVLVHGARPQIEDRMERNGIVPDVSNNIRVTDSDTLSVVKDATGSLRIHIEALLTMGLINSPMHGSQIRVSTGNFVIAKPIGVLDGVDFKHTGVVRKIDAEGINSQLHDGNIVLLSPVGYSKTGEVFNLSTEDVATRTAVALQADKLITFTSFDGLLDDNQNLIKSCDLKTINQLLHGTEDHVQQTALRAIYNSIQGGVERCHSLNYQSDTALLQELFTREGAGTLVAKDVQEQISTATIDDVTGILELIEPLEQEGTLVKRSRELLETEIEQFIVLKKEDIIIACGALYPYEEAATGEVACVVIHPDYRGGHRGVRIIEALEAEAKEQGLKSIFILTTVSAHWFIEQGFLEAPLYRLPEGKQEMYNYQRKSKVFIKEI